MTIRYEGEGDVFKTECQTLTCPVNTVGVMGNGLALAFKNRIPGLFDFYKKACKEKTLTVGTLLVYPIPDSTKQVLLFPTKAFWGNPSKRSYLDDGLKFLKEHYKDLNIESLAMVPIGCGKGQIDYVLCLKPLLYEHLDDLDINVDILLCK